MTSRSLACLVLLLSVGLPFSAGSTGTDPREVLVADAPGSLRGLVGYDSLNVQRLGGWPFGAPEVVAVDEKRDLAFQSAGAAVVVFDVSDPADPVPISDSMWGSGVIQDLFYDPSTERLYAAQGLAGLEIWSVADPAAPVKLGRTHIEQYNLVAPIRGVEVWDRWAYVAASWGIIHRIDVTDPTDPYDYSYIVNFSYVDDLHYTDGFLYSAGQQIGKFRINADGSMDFAGMSTTHGTTIHVAGEVGYVPRNGELWILDVSGGSFPLLATFDGGGNIRDVTAAGDRAYPVDIFEGAYILDTADPENPTVVGHYPTGGSDVEVDGPLLHLPRGSGYALVDLTDPTDPYRIGYYDMVSSTYDVAMGEPNLAYLANGDGLLVLDATSLDRPRLLSRTDVDGPCYAVEVRGDRAYLTDQPTGLRIFDVADPTAPMQIGFLALDEYSRQLVVEEGIAYVVDPFVGVQAVDVADPTQPELVGVWTAPDWIWDLEVEGGYGYAPCDEAGVRILDLSDPFHPVEIGTYDPPGLDATDVTVEDGIAYVATRMDGLEIVDVADPTDPTHLGSLYISDWTFSGIVDVWNGYAFLDDQTTLNVIDCTDPTNPFITGYYEALATFGDFHVRDGVVHAANGSVGYQAFRFFPDPAAIGDSEPGGIPTLAITRVHPNPVLGAAEISFASATSSPVALEVLDVSGRRVRRLLEKAPGVGPRSVRWDGRDAAGRPVSGGVYFLRLSAEGRESTRRITVLR
ncbi:MAG: hypothetical protein GF346_02185 [Candidatus Eisenbacteria bacterium]|nr:hypothetical protein [Candidatus Latescibacterota bacterium]MBD3301240.1 hypothetical protein [Candidatus Eisenbacteria bacterium]